MATFDVFEIHTYPATSNEYGVSRNENWMIKKRETFLSESAAREFIHEKSRLHTSLPTFLNQIHDPLAKVKFLDDFCFDDARYLHHRRYFLGVPPVKEIMLALKKEGIVVVA